MCISIRLRETAAVKRPVDLPVDNSVNNLTDGDPQMPTESGSQMGPALPYAPSQLADPGWI